MKFFSSSRFLDNSAVLLSVLFISVIVGLALSIAIYGFISYGLIAVIVLAFLTLLIARDFSGKQRIEENNRDNDEYAGYIIACVLLIGIFLYGRQFEYASIWGDMGVYVTAASHFGMGGSLPFSLPELGWDLAKDEALTPPRGMINPTSDGRWQFHGLPVWPALMAFSYLPDDGRAVLSLLFSANIFLFYTAAKFFSKDNRSAAITTVMFSVLPLAWHQAVYPTSEMLLLTIFLSGLVCLVSLKNPAIYVSAAMFAYGVVHTGVLILSPIFGFMLFFAGVFSRKAEKQTYALIGIGSAAAAFSALKFAEFASEFYTQAIVFGLFGRFDYLAYVACLTPVAAALPWIFSETGVRFPNIVLFLAKKALSRFDLLACSILLSLVVVVIVKGYLIGWTEYYVPVQVSEFNSWSARVAYVNRGFYSLLHLSFVNIFLASGGLGLIGFVASPWRFKRFDLRLKCLWLFACGFFIVFGLYQPDIPNNFYASRYFLPVLVPCFMLLASFLISKRRILQLFVIPMALLSFYFNGATVGSGFYLGEEPVTQFIEEQINRSQVTSVEGSDWLRYRVFPKLISASALKGEGARGVESSARQPRSATGLISDNPFVVGGERECLGYIERNIPWQIGYPIEPELIKRNICVYRPSRFGDNFLWLASIGWLADGKFNFIVVAPGPETPMEIEVHSLGWWAGKKPFLEDLAKINPELVVCGTKFTLTRLGPQSIVFHGTSEKSFCKAQLTTATFVPSMIGESEDKRSLGADIYAISLR